MSINAVSQTTPMAAASILDRKPSKAVEQEIKASEEAVRKAMYRLQELSSRSLAGLQISVHEAIGTFTVRVIDAHNGSVIREIPSEHVLNSITRIMHEGIPDQNYIS